MTYIPIIKESSVYESQTAVTIQEEDRTIKFIKNSSILLIHPSQPHTNTAHTNTNTSSQLNTYVDTNGIGASGTVSENLNEIKEAAGGKDMSTKHTDIPIFGDEECTSFSDGTEIGEYICNCYGILGTAKFFGGPYLILITGVRKCGRLLLEHDVYTITSKRIIPLYTPVLTTSEECGYLGLFEQYDISNHFYFSYTYNLANSVQLNKCYDSLDNSNIDWLSFDSSFINEKFRYNYEHKESIKAEYGPKAEFLCLCIIYGYYGESTLCLSGRSITLSLISRRSRHYAGTRYRKRGITASGNVANDVETEQIVYDWFITKSILSFVQIRGSTPTFWSQDSNQSMLKNPPIIFPQIDPTFSSIRNHVKDLFYLYGSPLVCLNLLSDEPGTDEFELSKRYNEAVSGLNAELPECVHVKYLSKNIRRALVQGVAKQMLKEVIDMVLMETNFFHQRNGVTISLQIGVLRANCLDSLDRTSAFALHLGLFIFKNQLARIGITTPTADYIYYNDDDARSDFEYRFNEIKDPIFQVIKEMYESMCDVLSMHYAGSRALRKYEGQSTAANISLQLITNLQRRYHSYFADYERQVQSNVFLGIHKAGKYPTPWNNDVDSFIHFEELHCDFQHLDWWVTPLSCFIKRIKSTFKSSHPKPWMSLFNEDGEYIPWIEIAQLIGNQRCLDDTKVDDYNVPNNIMFITKKNNYFHFDEELGHYGNIVKIIQRGYDEQYQNMNSLIKALYGTLDHDVPGLENCKNRTFETSSNQDDFTLYLHPQNIQANAQHYQPHTQISSDSEHYIKHLKPY